MDKNMIVPRGAFEIVTKVPDGYQVTFFEFDNQLIIIATADVTKTDCPPPLIYKRKEWRKLNVY